MICKTLVLVAMLASSCIGLRFGYQDPVPPPISRQSLAVNELEPKLDDTEVTIKFVVKELGGIAQKATEGQAPSFRIDTDNANLKNSLDVWIEGELANILDRLQMGAFQDNPLKVGTTIVATGKLTHCAGTDQYLLSVTKWQDFRILAAEDSQSEQNQ